MHSVRTNEVLSKIKEAVQGAGLEVIECTIRVQGHTHIVRVLIDYPEGGVTMDECSRVNRLLCALIEEDGTLGDDFTVEVHSPGLKRPLKGEADFRRAKGKEIMVWLNEPITGKTYLEGSVVGFENQTLTLSLHSGMRAVRLANIKTAKYKM